MPGEGCQAAGLGGADWGSPPCSDPQQGTRQRKKKRRRRKGDRLHLPLPLQPEAKYLPVLPGSGLSPWGPAGAASSKGGISTWQKPGHFAAWFYR